jgi:hypothetical protein
MTLKTMIAAAVLALSPMAALASGCGWGKSEQASMTCADGTVYDAATASCVVVSG